LIGAGVAAISISVKDYLPVKASEKKLRFV
jgi:hypothetical protein